MRPELGVPDLDVSRDLDQFPDVLDLYRQGMAETELVADELTARSLIPPGTAAVRDFSRLAATLPEFLPEACTGCMACVNICPDAALFAAAVPTSALTDTAAAYAAATDADAAAVLGRFAATRKYGANAEARGLEPAHFGIAVDASKCKGCAECVDVCPVAALRMVDKLTDAGDGRTYLAHAAADLDFYRRLPPTPAAYRSDTVLGDLMLGEHAYGYVGGAGSCAGCGEGTAIRMLVAATRQVHGPDSMGIVASTGCNSVFGATYPYNPYLVPWTNSLFENAPADALGIRARWDQEGHPERKLWVIGGDGAMYDIGFQSLSRMLASGADINVMVLDTQVYSNTGGQSSTASFGGQVTKLSAFGTAQHGRPERRKELGRIAMAHGDVYVAQTTAAHPNHFYRAVMEANQFPGPSVIVVYGPCMPEHGIADDAGARRARAAVESRAFPLFVYDPRRGPGMADRLDLAANPQPDADWQVLPSGDRYDFLAFAREEGRFAAHFSPDGTPTSEITDTQQERLANWRLLQELAGIRRGASADAPPSAPAVAAPSFDDVQALAARCIQCPDPTCVKGCPIRVDIPRYLDRVVAGDLEGAARSLLADNPLSCVTSRVCAQETQCEGACVLAPKGGAVAIGLIERYVSDWAREHLPELLPGPASGRRVAVVGSGPGGLACASELVARGHEVTVFEAYRSPGGVLRYGIPEFRLSRPVVDREVERLRGLGVRFETGAIVGAALSLAELHASFDAVFVAIGLGRPVEPHIDGAGLRGVLDANAFLEQVNAATADTLDARSVLVVGAGNTAMDAARAGLRLGAERVTVVYRRTRAEAPAAAAELHEAEGEGVRFQFLAAPLAVVDDGSGAVAGLRCGRMTLGDPDASGRPTAVPTGEELELPADVVIFAVGSRPDSTLADSLPDLRTDPSGHFLVGADGSTSVPGIFAGGDIVRGSATVVEAAADGKQAAASIDAFLSVP